MKSTKEFTLNCSDESFVERRKNVFDQLLVIEKSCRSTSDELMEVDKGSNEISSSRKTIKSFRGKESIFKIPQDMAPRNFLRRLPDYKKNPHKWTKYTLEDVRDEDISEKGNTKAALSFLKELNQRNDKTTNNLDEIPKKIIFQKHVVSSTTKELKDEDKPSFKSSKLVMPEYVVGQKIKKNRKNPSTKVKTSRKELKLDHLLEDDEVE
ncbi:hypothetical protein HHI36_020307 [Cryptolaemus montrouzieri]|uniref:U5 small nuclear ribonucleoprotein TSSC4 n=1 Tax=Cryptolaemus montrouzieri TaxID=559131 RepID=A0ABD2N9U7_9CUCU